MQTRTWFVASALALFGLSGAGAGEAHAACDIAVQARWSAELRDPQIKKLSFQLQESSRRTKGGWWSKWTGMPIPEWADDVVKHREIARGESWHATLRTDFGCDASRQYRFVFHALDGQDRKVTSKTIEFPGSSGWTTLTRIDVGELARYFGAARARGSR